MPRTTLSVPAMTCRHAVRVVTARLRGRRPVLAVSLPGRLARSYREGAHLAPQHPGGVITFEEFLAGRTSASRR